MDAERWVSSPPPPDLVQYEDGNSPPQVGVLFYVYLASFAKGRFTIHLGARRVLVRLLLFGLFSWKDIFLGNINILAAKFTIITSMEICFPKRKKLQVSDLDPGLLCSNFVHSKFLCNTET